jgi:hypothetical protein
MSALVFTLLFVQSIFYQNVQLPRLHGLVLRLRERIPKKRVMRVNTAVDITISSEYPASTQRPILGKCVEMIQNATLICLTTDMDMAICAQVPLNIIVRVLGDGARKKLSQFLSHPDVRAIMINVYLANIVIRRL